MTSNTTLNKRRHTDVCARMAMPYFGVKIYYVSLEMYGHTHI